MIKVEELGYIDKGTGKHQSNVVYNGWGAAPTITHSFGFKQPPTMFVALCRANSTRSMAVFTDFTHPKNTESKDSIAKRQVQ